METYRYKLIVTKLNNGKRETTIKQSRNLLTLNRLYKDKLNNDNIEQMAIYDYYKMKYVKYYEKEGE